MEDWFLSHHYHRPSRHNELKRDVNPNQTKSPVSGSQLIRSMYNGSFLRSAYNTDIYFVYSECDMVFADEYIKTLNCDSESKCLCAVFKCTWSVILRWPAFTEHNSCSMLVTDWMTDIGCLLVLHLAHSLIQIQNWPNLAYILLYFILDDGVIGIPTYSKPGRCIGGSGSGGIQIY